MGTKGKCLNMCPVLEIEMRERERLLHPLEILAGTEKNKHPTADRYRTVKCFCRSAAGINLTSPYQLRPTEVLLKTIKYLFTHVVNDTRFRPICVYDFIVDRLRSIQQDMVIQDLPPEDCIQILEPIVRFHALYAYRLCEEKIINYDPVLNKKHFLEYLKRLLVCYDEVENLYYAQSSELIISDMESLNIQSQNNSSLNFYTKEIISKRPLMEAIYIMSNLGDVHPLERFLRIPEKFKSPLLKSCFIASVSHITRNWIKECTILKTLPPLVLCVGILYLPGVRRNALEVMSHAYNSKVLKYPIENIKEILLYESPSQVMDDCHHYNIKIIEGKYTCFLKDSFNGNNAKVTPVKTKFLDELLHQTNLENHLLGDIGD